MDELVVRPYGQGDVAAMRMIWNEVVEDAVAFPQIEPLESDEEADAFFASQSETIVAEADGMVLGLAIIHPNNIGRCGHIANASYAVSSKARGRHVGRAIVTASLHHARELGFRVMQFNAVVASNAAALHLYESIGFTRMTPIPGGFLNGEGVYEDVYPHYFDLTTL